MKKQANVEDIYECRKLEDVYPSIKQDLQNFTCMLNSHLEKKTN